MAIMEKAEAATVTTGAELHPDLEKTATRRSHTDALSPDLMASEADAELLAKLGYTQELRRNFRLIEIFGISFSIIGLLPSIASTLAFSIPAGPAGMVWGWFTASMFIFIVGVAMADLGSAMPTAGGLYWWTFHFASEKYRKALCFLVGYSNTLGYVAGLCSIDYGFALMLCSVVVVARDGNWSPSNGVIYSVFLGCVIVHGILASTLSKIMNKLQTVSVALQLILIVATIIALPIGRSFERNSAKFTFTHTENLTTWPIGWAFMLSWLSPIWTIGGFDSCVHMSEEAKNAAKAVPYGILMATSSTWILGFVIMIVLGSCINPNLSDVLETDFGQPMAQIYFDALGKNGALGFMSLLFICQFTMGLSILTAASRQTWAFSRDGALPFSTFFRPISKTLGYIPLRCIWGCVLAASVLGLLSLIAPAAANALFALTVTGNNLAYLIPIFSRVFWGQDKFTPGTFYTGHILSPIIAWIAVIYLVFSTILVMFPGGGPDPEPADMNYAVVINAAVWGGSMIYYFAFARKWFKGPKTTIGIEGVSGGHHGASPSGGSESETVEKVVDG